MVLERRKGNHPQHSSVIMVEETVSSSSSTTKLHFHSPLELELEEQRQFLPSTGEDEDKEERVHTSRSKGISDLEAGFSLAKAIMGAGSFALPWAFLQMGYIAGPIFLTLLMAVSIYSLQLLVQCAKYSTSSNRNEHHSSYVQVARAVFGTTGARLSFVASCSASIGVCGSYLIFIAANLRSLIDTTISQTTFILLVLPFAIALSSVRDMKKFAFASLLGDVSVVLGMVVVLVYGLMYHWETIGTGCVALGSIETIPLAFGTVGYLFLVHFLSLPIESSMEHPERFEQVARMTFLACAVLSGSFGILGYLLFGPDTNQIVLLNVQGSFFIAAVKLLLCVDLLLTYPVVMRPSIVIVEQSVQLTKGKSRSMTPLVADKSTHLITCILLGIVAAGASIFVPAFGLLSGLVGGVSQTFLALVLPPLMLNKMQHTTMYHLLSSKGRMMLVVFGVIMILWTLVSTIHELS